MRILITGSRSWRDADTIEAELISVVKKSGLAPEEVTVVHGGASGADKIAGAAAEMLGMQVEVHPADWALLGKRAGFVRNEEMVRLGADVVLAFWDGSSKGTAHTMNLALNHGLNLKVFRS